MTTAYQVDLVFGTQRADTALARMEQRLRQVDGQAQRSGRDSFGGIARGAAKAESSVSSLVRTMGTLAATAGIGAAAVAIGKLGVQAEQTNTRLAGLSRGYDDLAQVQEAARQSAEKFGLSQQAAQADLAQVYGRLRPLGFSLSEITDIYQGFNTAARNSGASAQESAGAFRQLAQALGSGTLRGDEFNSIMEQAPVIGQEVAKVMGINAGQLREFAAEGKITGDVVLKALQNIKTQGAEQLTESLGTTGGAITRLQSGVSDLGAAMGSILLPAIDAVVNKAAEAVNVLTQMFQVASNSALQAKELEWQRGGEAYAERTIRNPFDTAGKERAKQMYIDGQRADYNLANRPVVPQVTSPRPAPSASATGAGGAKSGSRRGSGGARAEARMVEYLHGDPNRRGYDRAHGTQSNAHDHLGFSSEELARFVMAELNKAGVKTTRFGVKGGHSKNSLHYKNLAFDVPWAQFGSGPIGERDFAQSRRVEAIARDAVARFNRAKGGSGGDTDNLAELERQEYQKAVDAAKRREEGLRTSGRQLALSKAELQISEANTDQQRIQAEADKERMERMYKYADLLSNALSDEERSNILKAQGLEIQKATVEARRQESDLLVRNAQRMEAAIRPRLDNIERLEATLRGPSAVRALDRRNAIGEMSAAGVDPIKAGDMFDREQALDRQVARQRELNSLWEQGGQTLGGLFSDLIRGTDDWQASLTRALESLASVLLKAGLSSLAESNQGGFLGGLLNSLMGSFDGGGYTGAGSRTGGLDGKGGFMAMLHPDETVIDHTKGQSTGGDTYAPTINVSVATDGSTKVSSQDGGQLGRELEAAVTAVILRQKRPGGALAGR